MSRLSKLRAATFAVAALSLCAIAQAQWPARWDTLDVQPDEGQCVAVDHFGDVYVAGKSKEFRSPYMYYDLTVVKYDALGDFQWKKNYHSKDSLGGDIDADAIATGIAVDWEGSVYVSGLASNGSENKMVVFKVLPDGTAAWPASGSAGTGAIFNNRAIMLSDGNTDGSGPAVESHPPICAISMEDVPGAQPTFAITGPTDDGTHHGIWRSVVFEYNATYGVHIKSGWPVDDFGYSDEDSPFAVAINPADSTVTVTGGAHVGGTGSEFFTTRKYSADGSTVDWTDTEGGGTKCNYGKAIALDPSGNVYATGYLSTGDDEEDSEYETVRINGSSGTSHDIQYSETYLQNEATSISLSTELVEGTPSTFIYVTGLSDHDNGMAEPGPLEMATLRYSYSGSALVQEWSGDGAKRESATGDCIGASLVAAGNGDCYVAGLANNGSDNDYILAAYKKDGSKRYSNVIFDNGGADDARAIGMLGPGLPVYTGASFGSGEDLDFYTLVHSGDTIVSAYPDSYSQDDVYISGDLSSLTAVDSDWLEVNQISPAHTSPPTTTFNFSTPISTSPDPVELSLSIVSHVNKDHFWQEVDVWDANASAYVEVSNRRATNGTDDTTTIMLPGDPNRYISSGYAYVQVIYYGNVADGFTSADANCRMFINLVQWNAIY